MQIRKKSKSQLHKQLKRAPLKAGDVLLKRSFNSREIQCWAAFPEHWCQVTSQSPENNSQVVCHAPIGCPLPPYTRIHQRNLWAYQSRVNFTVKALAYSHF